MKQNLLNDKSRGRWCIVFIIALVFLVPILANAQTASKPVGAGTMEDPYQIATLNNLYWIYVSSPQWDKYYIQTANIDATATKTWYARWIPIGNNSNSFKGVYDGRGFTITGLSASSPSGSRIGLFGSISSSAIIANLTLENVDITGKYSVGGIVGYNEGLVSNCSSSGIVTASGFNGGLVGENFGKIQYCFSNASVSSSNTSGGLVGRGYSGSISNCYSTGGVTITGSYAGGFVGNSYSAVLSNCYSVGKVTCSTQYFGGFAGLDNAKSTVINSFWDKETSETTSGINTINGTFNVSGKTTAEMKTQSTFTDAGWDFGNIWAIDASINNGYPYLISTSPVIYTGAAENITYTSASVKAIIGYLGKNTISAYGVCWNTTGNPTISDNFKNMGTLSSIGRVDVPLEGLTAFAKYYVKAYITTSAGTFYGDQIVFDAISYLAPAGSGTSADPYKISSFENLNWLTNNSATSLNKYYVQTCNIDFPASPLWLSGEGFLPINSFAGNYDGRGFYVSNVYINRPSLTNVGLFGSTSNAIISNLGMKDVNISGANNTGGLIGSASSTTVTNCYVLGNVTGKINVGGMFGNAISGSTISQSYTNTIVLGDSEVGGFVGFSDAAILDCYSSGTCTSAGNLGGFSGLLNSGNVQNCYTSCALAGTGNKGGFTQRINSATISGCFWDKELSGITLSSGGVGKTTAEMRLQLTFVSESWDFVGETTNGSNDYWTMISAVNNGYPCLMWQLAEPSVSTQAVSDVTSTTATLKGNIVSLGVPNPTQYGFVWGQASSPTLELSSKTEQGEASSVAEYSYSVSGLTPNTKYYVRSYATNALGTVYGNEQTFTTPAIVLTIGGNFSCNSKTYDGTANASISSNNLVLQGVNSSFAVVSLSNLVVSFTSVSAGDNVPVNINSAEISGVDADKYILSLTNAPASSAKIEAKGLVITAKNQTKEYGASFAFSGNEFTFSVLVAGDAVSSVSFLCSGVSSSSPVSNYSITPSSAVGTGLSNYSITYMDGQMSVTKVPLTVTANNASMVYGDAIPSFSYRVDESMLKNGDAASVVTGSAVFTSFDKPSVGNYDINLSGLDADNYSLNFVKGNLSVDKAPLSITANNTSMLYGDVVPAFSYSVDQSMLKNGDAESVVTGSAVFTSFDKPSVGNYDVNLSGLNADNYALTFTKGNLSVAKAPLTVTANNASMVYGDVVPTFSYSVDESMLKNGDAASVVTGSAVFTTFDKPSVGNYDVTLSGLNADNYSLTFAKGTLSVAKAPLTVTAENKSRNFGEDNPALTTSIVGFKNSDDESVFSNKPILSTLATTSSLMGQYPIVVEGGQADNYSLSLVNGILTINPIQGMVSVNEIVDITNTTATVQLSNISNGGDEGTEYGVCYSTQQNPTTGDVSVMVGANSNFKAALANLERGTIYYVKAYAKNNAGTYYSEQQQFTTKTTGVEVENSFDVSIYPNPCRQWFNVNLADVNTAILTMHDISGRLVLQQEINEKSTRVNLNGNFKLGIYIVTVKTDNQRVIKKLIVQ